MQRLKIKCYICRIVPNILRHFNKYLVVACCLISFGFQQPNSYDANSKFKALFLYNFTKYFDWPAEKKTEKFIIYVVGKSDALVSELKNLAGKKKVGEQDIEVKNTPVYDHSAAYHIICFAPDNDSKVIGEGASKCKKQGTLIVSETNNGAKSGAAINFIFVDSKLRFEYNKNSAVKAGLITHEDFKALAAVNID